MRVIYTKQADKQLSVLDSKAAALIVRKVAHYAENPASLANQVMRLKGSGHLRLRVGDYRVIFTADGVVVTVIKVGHRREVYD
jgi:mRNA interferase RelE/StbE